MVAAKTTADLLTEVREQCQLPDADGRLDSDGILRLGSQRLTSAIANMLVSLRQERWVTTHTDVTIVSGTASYRIPSRALAAGVADILIRETASGTEWSANEIPAVDRWRYSAGAHGYSRAPWSYTWEGDHIVLLPTPDASGYTLRIRYPRQPARLVQTSAAALITSTPTSIKAVVSSVPSAFGSVATVDVVEGTPHGDVLLADKSATISGTDVTITAGLGSEVAAGDYVCLAGQTCVPPIPELVWPLLVAETSLAVLRAVGDPEGIADARERLAEERVHVRNVLAPRNRGESQKLVNHYSALRGGRFPSASRAR